MAPYQRRSLGFEIGPDSEHDEDQRSNNTSTNLTRVVSPSFSRAGRGNSILSRITPITAPTIGNIETDLVEYNAPSMEIDTTIEDDDEDQNHSQALTTTSQARGVTRYRGGNAGQNSQASTLVRSGGGESGSGSVSGSHTVTRRTVTREIQISTEAVHAQSFESQAPSAQFPSHHQHRRHRRRLQHGERYEESLEFEEMARRQLEFEYLSAADQIIQERWAQEQLRLNHKPCIEGFGWDRVEGGYECYGGSHAVPDELLVEGMGGFMVRNRRLVDGTWYGPLYTQDQEEMKQLFGELIATGLWWEGVDPNSNHPRLLPE